jgi:cytidine deaminase
MDSYRGDGLNLYAYVQNNPINYIDPSGHCTEKDNKSYWEKYVEWTNVPFSNTIYWGVDVSKEYERYVLGARNAGDTPVDQEIFVNTFAPMWEQKEDAKTATDRLHEFGQVAVKSGLFFGSLFVIGDEIALFSAGVKEFGFYNAAMMYQYGALKEQLAYSQSLKLPSEEELSNAIAEWSKMQKSLAPSKRQASKFNTGTVVYDVETGQYYYGMNRGVQVSGDTLNETLAKMLPKKSLNQYRLGNCAEVDAVNQALQNNANLHNLYMYTIEVNSGTPKPMCDNCIYAFEGAVREVLSK